MTATPKLSQRLRLALACCVSGVVAAACAASAPEPLQPTSELTGTRWVAAAIDGAAIAGPRAPQLSFGAADRLTGTGGCNSLFGVYEAKSGYIDVRGLGRTEMACDQPLMRQEEAFVAILQSAERYRYEPGRLVITGENGASVTLNAVG